MEEIKRLIEELNRAFMEHKSKNDQRLAEIQKKGYADPILEEQVETIFERPVFGTILMMMPTQWAHGFYCSPCF